MFQLKQSIILSIFLILKTYTYEISAEDYYGGKVLHQKHVSEVPHFTLYDHEQSDLYNFDPTDRIYEIDIKLKTGNTEYKSMCWAEQPETGFYQYDESYSRAFPDHFNDDGSLNDLFDIIPYMIAYTLTDDGLVAIDHENNLIFFEETIDEASGRPYLARNNVVPITGDNLSDLHETHTPHLAYIKLLSGQLYRPYIFIAYPDKCISYSVYDNNFNLQINWMTQLSTPYTEILKVSAGYGGRLSLYKNQKENFYQYESGLLFVAAGEVGFTVYEVPIKENDVQIRLSKQFTAADIANYNGPERFYVPDFSHVEHENQVFFLDSNTGVYRVTFDTGLGTGENDSAYYGLNLIENFLLKASNSIKVAHVSNYEPLNLAPQQISFMILTDINNMQSLIEYDYNINTNQWYKMEDRKYNFGFEVNQILMASHYALLIGSQFQRVVPHSVYRYFKKETFSQMSIQEQYEESTKNTVVIPGLMGANFYNQNFYNSTLQVANNQQEYLMGISPHQAITYKIENLGAKVKCDMKIIGERVDPGDYLYEVSFYQSFCSIDENGETRITYSDNEACRYTQNIKVTVVDTREEKMPGWGIALIVIISVLFVSVVVFGGIKIYQAKTLEKQNQEILDEKEQEIEQLEKENKTKYQSLADHSKEINV